MKMRITCKEATRIIIEKEESPVSIIRRFQLWMHLGICSLCKLFEKQNQTMNHLLKQVPENETYELSDAEKNHLINTLESLE